MKADSWTIGGILMMLVVADLVGFGLAPSTDFNAKAAKVAKAAMPMDVNEINVRSRLVIETALRVHSVLGPGLLESAYEACMCSDLRAHGHTVAAQVPIAVQYGELRLDVAYRADLIVDDVLIIELKAVPKLLAVHSAQLLSYLRLGDYRLGILINFHEKRLKNGIKRVVNGL